MADLDLGLIGNCSYGALINRLGRVVWCCLPRFDGDPVFNQLLNGDDGIDPATRGLFQIDLDGCKRTHQHYVKNTAVLVTELRSENDSGIEITDFAPRFVQYGRMFRPMTMVRIVRPLVGTPRIRILLRPMFGYGATAPQITHGSNSVRYVGPSFSLRLTTDAPISYVLDETPFLLEEPIVLLLGPDETLTEPVPEAGRRFLDNTIDYWRRWARRLAVPIEWQDAVIRAAITLKLCSFEETGAIVAAMTTSVPEAPDSRRNWDYRYCWLRDAYFVVRALNRLGDVSTMENYLRYLVNLVAETGGVQLQPVYGIGREARLPERQVDTLVGYRGMGPVRVGNQAYQQVQHDTYGHVVMAATQAFFDERLLQPATPDIFSRLEAVGARARELFDRPDAGVWEFRTRNAVHTSSAVMCWAACDRLAKIASHLGLGDRAANWRANADHIHGVIMAQAWNEKITSFTDVFGGVDIDAGLLLMREVNFLPAAHPRFRSTLARIEQRLKRGAHIMRYDSPDDVGLPQTSFMICTFWYLEALADTGRVDEAREAFEALLACRNHLGLLSEDVDPATGELWGNFPQTYSQVGLINCARRLSERWENVL